MFGKVVNQLYKMPSNYEFRGIKVKDSQTVRVYLEEGIETGRFSVGERLPTERALSDNLQVSRSAVRDALAVLQEEGIVVRRPGSGTYVGRVPAYGDEQRKVHFGFGPKEVMEARFLIEPRLARFAVMGAKGEDLEALEAAAVKCEMAKKFDEYELADAEFHRCLAHATGNLLMVALYEVVERERRAVIWGSMRKRFLTPERREESRREHRHILNAILNRDADEAEALVQTHLNKIMVAMLSV
ncbi:FadR family transcriptional regulator [bacterium SCSIO 12827]|nr:FadR family transcriptional regulator [bacterium SCSIO 12827]